VDVSDILTETLQPIQKRLSAMPTKKWAAVVETYPQDILGDARWKALGNLFVERLIRQAKQKKKSGISTALSVFQKATALGFKPEKIPGINISFVEVTSKTLLKHGQIDFPAEIVVDIPIPVSKAELDQVLSSPKTKSANYVIVFNVALAKAHRRIATKKSHTSTYLAGYRTEPNPEYNLSQSRLSMAQTNMQTAQMGMMTTPQNQPCVGFACLAQSMAAWNAQAKVAAAQDTMHQAMLNLQKTPMTLQVPVYKPYRYDVASIKSSKNMTVHYYVIDRRKSSYFKSTFDVAEKKTFSVAFATHNKDPEIETIKGRHASERDVSDWEAKASTVRLSQIAEHYVENAKESKPLPSHVAFRSMVLRDKNKAIATHSVQKYDARPLNDPRFDHVVVVMVPNAKSLGTGFYVRPDIVLTNWHVVENAKFIEMKTYNGRETFGKVYASDISRDLALIKVQARGKPVQFYTKKTLDLGKTVEAIGHPKGLEFSISHGVVSAVRRADPVVLPGGTRDKVLFIQTDAAINHGNSGGPLFMGNKVIGVNTQGRTDGQNLSFAVHYSEVQTFLRENLPALK
jgi:serine protease Do